ELSPLSLHDALPICRVLGAVQGAPIDIFGLQKVMPPLPLVADPGPARRCPKGACLRTTRRINILRQAHGHVVPHIVIELAFNLRSEEHTSELQSREK